MNTAISSDCNVDHVISAIQQRKKPGPATVEVIRKALPKPIQPTKEILGELLREGVRDGRIWEYSSRNNQTAYWTQSPFEMAAQKVHSLLEQGTHKETNLKKKMMLPELSGRIDPADVLSRLTAEARIFVLPTSSPSQVEYSLTPIDVDAITTATWLQIEEKLLQKDRKGSELKSTLRAALRGVLEPEEFIRALIADKKLYLTSGEVGKPSAIYSLKPIDVEAAKQKAWNLIEQKLQTKAKTEQQIHKLIDPLLRGIFEPLEYFRSLVAAKRLFPLFKNAKSTETTYGLKPVDHAPAVQKIVGKLVSDLEKLTEKNGVAIKDLYEIAISQLRGRASEVPSSDIPLQPFLSQQTPSITSSEVDQSLKDRIRATLYKINPRIDEGELVLVRQLRLEKELSDITKLDFDRLMLNMFRDRVIVLSRQWSGHVPPVDQDLLVTDGKGNFYNTVALWRD